MEKQLQLIMSAIFMVLASLTSYGQSVGDQFDVDNIRYKITSIASPEVMIVVYEGTATEVDIPGTVDYDDETYTVTAIGEDTDVFQGNLVRPFIGKGLTRVTIPNTVTLIGLGAFTNNALTEVDIPNSVTHIRRWGFSGNPLNEVTIPASVEYIGPGAFFGSTDIPIVRCERNPPPEIHETAFASPFARKMSLVVPFSAIQAYEDAGWKDNIGFVNITAGITTINRIVYGLLGAPNEATVLDHIVSNSNGVDHNPIILSEVNIDGGTYDVTAIGDGAFKKGGVLSIHIPSSIRSIGSRALYASTHAFVVMEGENPPTLAPDAFQYPQRHDRVNVVIEGPSAWAQSYINAGWTGFKSLTPLVGQLHNSNGILWKVTSLNPNEMELHDFNFGIADNEDITVVVDGEEVMVFTDGHLEIPTEIPYSRTPVLKTYTVTSIGDNAFNRYSSAPLTSVNIPDTVTHIGNSAFAGNQLTEVDIPDGVTSIGEDAFWQNRLTGVEIPESVTSLGQRAFGTCGLTEVTIPNSITRIEQWVFAQNDLEEVTIPANVEYIGEQAFYQNDLKEVTIPGNVRTIDLYAFQRNPDLHLVTVEADDPPSLHELAFSNADRGQIDLVVPMGRKQEYLDNGWHGFRSISYGIFTVDNIIYGITSRTEVMVVGYTGTDTAVTIPETADDGEYAYTVAAIGKGALQNKGLTDVGIPSSVTSIGEGAFSDNQLTAVTLPGGVERIDGFAFHNNPGLALVTVEANDPPVLDATAFANANRHQIDLVVPTGKRQDYLDNGWNGFKSIKEEIGVSIDAPAETVNLSPFTVTFQFDLDVTGFTVDDIDLGGNATADHFTGSGSIYTVEVTPTSCNGAIAIDVPANATDMPNSTNLQATATVTVEEDPNYLVAIAKDITVQLDADGQVTILPEDVDNGSAYGCGNTPELSLDRDAFTCDDVGTPVTVILTADHGTESATTTATVTVEEDPNYLVAIAKDITVQLDAGGRATILPEDVDDGSVYGCGNTPELSLDMDAFTCDDVRTPVTVILTANHGTESTTATALVTVEAATGSCGKSSSLVNFNRGFSPNGDGSGDTLVIEGLEKYRNNVLKIYDLSQRLLFSAHYGGPGDGWDGTDKRGLVPVGSYVCVIDYNEPGLGHEAKMIYVNY
ncbi:leucine-rich repeat protein [Allomuricauda sp. R78024]|uniref:leucine-rich repeat protein n=1 Tax=Allomuricauda sp. R78024 TaxID=3093867 RepID=UPI0037C83D33